MLNIILESIDELSDEGYNEFMNSLDDEEYEYVTSAMEGAALISIIGAVIQIGKNLDIDSIAVYDLIRGGVPEKEAIGKMAVLCDYLYKQKMIKRPIDPKTIDRDFALRRRDFTVFGIKQLTIIEEATHRSFTASNVHDKFMQAFNDVRDDNATPVNTARIIIDCITLPIDIAAYGWIDALLELVWIVCLGRVLGAGTLDSFIERKVDEHILESRYKKSRYDR